jgi:ligand-binding SRPBCC domain-containing protein
MTNAAVLHTERRASAYRLVRTTQLAGDLATVFAFFKDPHNLETITPPWLGFRITSTSDAVMRSGTRIRYRLRLHGIPMSWESRITEFVENSHFSDEQITGPYSLWYHRHSFRTVDGGVEMTDDVVYRLPFGPLGRLVHWLAVRHQLRAIFDYRTKIIAEQFAATRSNT